MKLLKSGEYGETYNIGANNERSNLEVVKLICEIIDKTFPREKKIPSKNSKELISFVDDRPAHDIRYSLNTTKICNKLNWEAQIKFKEGLTNTIKWYLENKEWWIKIIEKNSQIINRKGKN